MSCFPGMKLTRRVTCGLSSPSNRHSITPTALPFFHARSQILDAVALRATEWRMPSAVERQSPRIRMHRQHLDCPLAGVLDPEPVAGHPFGIAPGIRVYVGIGEHFHKILELFDLCAKCLGHVIRCVPLAFEHRQMGVELLLRILGLTFRGFAPPDIWT